MTYKSIGVLHINGIADSVRLTQVKYRLYANAIRMVCNNVIITVWKLKKFSGPSVGISSVTGAFGALFTEKVQLNPL